VTQIYLNSGESLKVEEKYGIVIEQLKDALKEGSQVPLMKLNKHTQQGTAEIKIVALNVTYVEELP
jgi:hypothetical protein